MGWLYGSRPVMLSDLVCDMRRPFENVTRSINQGEDKWCRFFNCLTREIFDFEIICVVMSEISMAWDFPLLKTLVPSWWANNHEWTSLNICVKIMSMKEKISIFELIEIAPSIVEKIPLPNSTEQNFSKISIIPLVALKFELKLEKVYFVCLVLWLCLLSLRKEKIPTSFLLANSREH